MNDTQLWFVRTGDGKIYGPAEQSKLIEWVQDGRIEPSSHLSIDRKSWEPAQTVQFLEMKWLVETDLGKFFGPFNRSLIIKLSKEGKVPQGARFYNLHELEIDKDKEPVIVEKEVRVEVPVEKMVEVEKIVEKEIRVEVPVEKIVEVIPPSRKTVVADVVEDPVDTTPPINLGGIFKDVSVEQLKALEVAAQREIASSKRKFSGFFGRR
jgi:hypothetical protein